MEGERKRERMTRTLRHDEQALLFLYYFFFQVYETKLSQIVFAYTSSFRITRTNIEDNTIHIYLSAV